MMYSVVITSGQEYVLEANSAKEAWNRAVQLWPDLLYKDIRDIKERKNGKFDINKSPVS